MLSNLEPVAGNACFVLRRLRLITLEAPLYSETELDKKIASNMNFPFQSRGVAPHMVRSILDLYQLWGVDVAFL